MNIYTPTQQEEDAVYNHLKSYHDVLIDYNFQFIYQSTEYDEALQMRDKDWQEECIDNMDMINKRIEAIYKGANLIATAYKKTECLY